MYEYGVLNVLQSEETNEDGHSDKELDGVNGSPVLFS